VCSGPDSAQRGFLEWAAVSNQVQYETRKVCKVFNRILCSTRICITDYANVCMASDDTDPLFDRLSDSPLILVSIPLLPLVLDYTLFPSTNHRQHLPSFSSVT
jgi:hypothetical protein